MTFFYYLHPERCSCFFSCFILGDMEKEKRRLQNIFATGQEEPTAAQRALMLKNFRKPEVVEKDRFQEGEADCTETDDVEESQ